MFHVESRDLTDDSTVYDVMAQDWTGKAHLWAAPSHYTAHAVTTCLQRILDRFENCESDREALQLERAMMQALDTFGRPSIHITYPRWERALQKGRIPFNYMKKRDVLNQDAYSTGKKSLIFGMHPEFGGRYQNGLAWTEIASPCGGPLDAPDSMPAGYFRQTYDEENGIQGACYRN